MHGIFLRVKTRINWISEKILLKLEGQKLYLSKSRILLGQARDEWTMGEIIWLDVLKMRTLGYPYNEDILILRIPGCPYFKDV